MYTNADARHAATPRHVVAQPQILTLNGDINNFLFFSSIEEYKSDIVPYFSLSWWQTLGRGVFTFDKIAPHIATV